MHWLALFVAFWMQAFPVSAPGAHVGNSARQKDSTSQSSAPASSISGDATSGLDPWG
jgi:hypothetical protein